MSTLSSISGFVKEHRENITATAAVALLGISVIGSDTIRYLVVGANIPDSGKRGAIVYSSLALTCIQFATEHYLPNFIGEPIWASRTISLFVAGSVISLIANKRVTKQIAFAVGVNIISTLASVQNIAIATGICAEAVASALCGAGVTYIFDSPNKKRDLIGFSAPITPLVLTAIATSYFYGPHNPLIHMGIIAGAFSFASIDSARTEKGYLNNQIRNQEKHIKFLQTKLENAATEKKALEETIALLRASNKNLNYQVADYMRKNSDLGRAFLSLQSEMENARAQSQLRTLAKEASTLLDDDIIFKRITCAFTQGSPICPVLDPNKRTFYEEAEIRHWLENHLTSPISRAPLTREDLIQLPKVQALFLSRLEFFRKLIKEHQNTPNDLQAVQEAIEELRQFPKLDGFFEDLLPSEPRTLEALDLRGSASKKKLPSQPLFPYLDLA